MKTLLLADIDWEKMFVPSNSILEIIIRGTITYWAIFLAIRFFRRGTGQLSISDLLLVILIADAAQNSMAGEYHSITEGIALVGTLLFWDFAIDWLGYRSVFFAKLAQPDTVVLVKDGIMQRKNMKTQLISEDELMQILRLNGVESLEDVKQCNLEGGGNISVIKQKRDD